MSHLEKKMNQWIIGLLMGKKSTKRTKRTKKNPQNKNIPQKSTRDISSFLKNGVKQMKKELTK